MNVPFREMTALAESIPLPGAPLGGSSLASFENVRCDSQLRGLWIDPPSWRVNERGVSEQAKERRVSEQVNERGASEQVKERGVSEQVKERRVNERAKGRRVRGRVKEKRARLRVGNFEISLVYCEEAAICPLPLIARRWVVLAEMSFSVRVHPAPFSPTPNTHTGI